MERNRQITEAIEASGIVGILRCGEGTDLVSTCRALAAGGLGVLEITLNTPGALEGIARVKSKLGTQIVIGAGTILNAADAQRAIAAGAQFIVTPTMQADSIQLCNQRGVPIVCGAMTPTEMLAAHSAGADYIKLFPAGSLGLDYIKAVLAPLPFLKIVPTGGVTLANLAGFLAAGCPAVAVGGSLVDPKLIAEQRWDDLAARAKQFAEAAQRARAKEAT